MVEPNKFSVICRNGHQLPNADSRFCIYCGTPLTTSPVPQFAPPQAAQIQQPPANQVPTQFNQNPPQQNYYPQPVQQTPFPPAPAVQCRTCGDSGQNLDAKTIICRECRWLRPLAPGYAIDCSAFQWAEDGKALSALRSITPLNAAAKAVSEKNRSPLDRSDF
ncbi:MAG TPA: hypothetical protein VF556_07270 [Pyrinomonadaceae bacterium]|jgi:hypothetical protein